MYQIYEVGKPTGLQGPDGVIFDMTDSGGILVIRMSRPTSAEKKAFRSGVSIRYCIVDQIVFVLARMGTMQWMDAPYYRGLSRNFTRIEMPSDGLGLAIQVLFVDGRDGILVGQKLISPDTTTSRDLMTAAILQPPIPDYERRLFSVMSRYTTEQLVEISCQQENQNRAKELN